MKINIVTRLCIGILLGGTLLITACGNNNGSSISKIEDSGTRLSRNCFSVAVPKNWEEGLSQDSEQENPRMDEAGNVYEALRTEGFTIIKDNLNWINVIMRNDPVDDKDPAKIYKGNLEETKKYLDKMMTSGMGASTVESEIKEYSFGKAICMVAKIKTIEDIIYAAMSEGAWSEEQGKAVKEVVGKDRVEVVIYYCTDDKIFCIDGVSFDDDLDGIKEATEFVANSLVIDQQEK